ncbi:dihydroorotate dehydrogenase electron transfer subunit [Hydrogenoanaerobacterium sp.]|uniref:dihydroorotate dehydrogenase electron transfer subunit n=1 Tax=Hydrogenoanaerobacterium sp. TaxID=2953763 RepID=UPI00289F8506|nr:dihydroorotate dehydrogenase electron transfer subunit [Hydrogenoanaerobacterium sp.]
MKKEFTVVEARMVAPHVASLTVLAPEVAEICKPGQFAHVYCGGGVYSLTRRPLSISKVEGDKLGFLFHVKGEGTKWLADRKQGDLVDIMAPLGSGCYELPENGNIIIAAGGIGLAPVIHLAQVAVAKGLTVSMVFGARDKDNVYCLEELERLGIPVQVATEDGSVGGRGFVTAPLERALQAEKPTGIFSCGPVPMLKAVVKLAKQYGVPVQVSMEERMACGVGACKGCVTTVKDANGTHYKNVCSDGPVFKGEEVFFDE